MRLQALTCWARIAPARRVAGVDVGFCGGGQVARAQVVVSSFCGLAPMQRAVAQRPRAFSHVPGLLSLREVPAVLARLAEPPDRVLVDGQGVAHPRRFGIACDLGLAAGLPCAGVAKTWSLGVNGSVAGRRGAWAPRCDHGDVLGCARPMFRCGIG